MADVKAMFADCSRPCNVAMLAAPVDEMLARELVRIATDAAPAFCAELTAGPHSGRTPLESCGNGDALRGLRDGGGVITLTVVFVVSTSRWSRLARKSR